jgi:hypothetical protein
MLLDAGRLADALALDATLLARPEDGAAGGALDENGVISASASRRAASAAASADAEKDLARVARLLADLETDCIAVAGPDAGCGLGTGCEARYSQHVRGAREAAIAEFLRSFPTKSCANCGAASVPIRKDG